MNMKTAWRYTYRILLFIISIGIIFEVHSLFHLIDKEQKIESFSFPYNSFGVSIFLKLRYGLILSQYFPYG